LVAVLVFGRGHSPPTTAAFVLLVVALFDASTLAACVNLLAFA
jgi:hypothetical protein